MSDVDLDDDRETVVVPSVKQDGSQINRLKAKVDQLAAKNTKRIDLPQAQRELKAEMGNAGNKWGFSIHKKRGRPTSGSTTQCSRSRCWQRFLIFSFSRRSRAGLRSRQPSGSGS